MGCRHPEGVEFPLVEAWAEANPTDTPCGEEACKCRMAHPHTITRGCFRGPIPVVCDPSMGPCCLFQPDCDWSMHFRFDAPGGVCIYDHVQVEFLETAGLQRRLGPFSLGTGAERTGPDGVVSTPYLPHQVGAEGLLPEDYEANPLNPQEFANETQRVFWEMLKGSAAVQVVFYIWLQSKNTNQCQEWVSYDGYARWAVDEYPTFGAVVCLPSSCGACVAAATQFGGSVAEDLCRRHIC